MIDGTLLSFLIGAITGATLMALVIIPEVVGQKKRIKELEAENRRIVSESKQCHQRNDDLVSERLQLKAKHTALVKGLRNELKHTFFSAGREFIHTGRIRALLGEGK
jgi:hypothetical protein